VSEWIAYESTLILHDAITAAGVWTPAAVSFL
jgi:hypothetical protein